MFSGGRGLGPHGRPDEDAVFPAEGLVDERHAHGTSSTEDDGVNGHALRVLPGRVQNGALGRRGAEPVPETVAEFKAEPNLTWSWGGEGTQKAGTRRALRLEPGGKDRTRRESWNHEGIKAGTRREGRNQDGKLEPGGEAGTRREGWNQEGGIEPEGKAGTRREG